MKLYFAGPLFTTAERIFNAAVVYHLRLYGHEVFLPQEHPQKPGEVTAHGIFTKEVDAMRVAEGIVVCADGLDPDSGSSWELGNCWRDKLSVVFRSDFRDADDGFPPCNLMLVQSANTFVNCKWKSVDQIAEAIDSALRALYQSGAIPKGRSPVNKQRKSHVRSHPVTVRGDCGARCRDRRARRERITHSTRS